MLSISVVEYIKVRWPGNPIGIVGVHELAWQLNFKECMCWWSLVMGLAKNRLDGAPGPLHVHLVVMKKIFIIH